MCEKLGCLPGEGGLFDQNPRYVRKLERALLAIQEHHNEEMKKTTQGPPEK